VLVSGQGHARPRVVSLARTQRSTTRVSDFSIHHVTLALYCWFEEAPKLATPEKALFYLAYLSAGRSRLFTAVPGAGGRGAAVAVLGGAGEGAVAGGGGCGEVSRSYGAGTGMVGLVSGPDASVQCAGYPTVCTNRIRWVSPRLSLVARVTLSQS